MPARRRTAKRRPVADLASLFLDSDGVTALWDGEETFDNALLARAAWQGVRLATWSHSDRDRRPPAAAVIYDGIGDALVSSPPGPGRHWTLDGAREAFEHDVASIEAFYRSAPRAAVEIADELDAYRADLRTLLAIAEEVPNDPNAPLRWGQYLSRHNERTQS